MKNYILITLILIVLCLFIYIFIGVNKNSNINYKEQIDSLQLGIIKLKNERNILIYKNDSLQKLYDSINSKIYIDKIKIINTIEYRDKENIIIKSMPDGELLELFSKFDSLSYKNR